MNDCMHGCKNDCKDEQEMLSCPHYDPKEKPMENKVIFESEEELKTMLNDCGIYGDSLFTFGKIVEYIKRKGYIRKSPVKEAEEMYKDFKEHGCTIGHAHIVVDKLFDAIQEQKAEIERYKSHENCKMEVK